MRYLIRTLDGETIELGVADGGWVEPAGGPVVDLSDAVGDYDIYTSEMVEERVEVKEGDILIIHTGYHRYGWDQPQADEIRYMVKHPGPDREFVDWCIEKRIKWLAVDCGSADHPMNTIIRNWMPRQAAEADKLFQEMYGATLAERFTPDKYRSPYLRQAVAHEEDDPISSVVRYWRRRTAAAAAYVRGLAKNAMGLPEVAVGKK